MKTKAFPILLLSTSLVIGTQASDYITVENGVFVRTVYGSVSIKVVNDKIIRVSAVPEGEFPADASLVVLPQAEAPEYTLSASDGYVSLSTGEVKAVVSEESGAVTFFDSDGRKILQEMTEGRYFTPISIEGTDGYTVRQSFESLNDSEGLYGLGQHQANEFNYKCRNEELFQYNTKVSVPFIVSTDNYGILWDSYSFCRWGRPDDYSQLGDVFSLYDKDGRPGALTGTYQAADGTTLVRDEPVLYFEHLIRGDLGHVVNAPRDFNFPGSRITFEGEIEARESGEFEFILYYSGYQTVYIDNRKVVDTRWRTAWNPNSYKFSLN
ncbi:MAG: DUF4968 domain-containing protein, partial [Muribaculaceae bacterium]|nr:DUF4968 domain-containing protein [Muribaculaceae bacterium]